MIIKNLSKSELLFWLQLSRTVGEVTFHSLISLYGTAENALGHLAAIKTGTKKIRSFSKADALKELELTEKFNASILSSCEKKYSKNLRLIRDPPPVLTVKGNIELLNTPSIAIVGSRNATINSCNFAYSLARELAEEGYTIISGLAVGVDTAALKITDSTLPTIAIIGTGIDQYYPAENQRLQDKIIERGGLVATEVPFGKRGQSAHFARRNRIISGLSECVIIIEASENSGSLLTAQYALAQGKYLFASPGAPYDKRFSGSNRLLKQGAMLIENALDVIQSLNKKKRNDFAYKTLLDVEDKEFIPFSILNYDSDQINHIKAQILKKIDSTSIPINQLAHELNIPEKTLLLAIVELEIEGKITRTIGNEVSLLCNQFI
ncbi:DNA-processing protein DprA [Neorickettsia sp. 179522]|uniref:DNA-processing protein DprA n=1 Tax=Neorickettsia sp. 179522 TaxID=1714371 RepID=UPI00079C5F8E|nr:DNA-processing protein DprA [Neorickettsia sp. 179522]KYH12475.1 DNA processing protein DprA [Neorickettsia sp. 179522]